MAGRRSKPTKTDDQITNVGTDSDYADQMHQAHVSATNSTVDKFLNKMTQDVTELKTSLQFTRDDIADLMSSMAELTRKPSAEDVKPVMTRQVKNIEGDLRSLANQADYLDNYSRRNCIRIDGIQDSPNEDWKITQAKVREILKKKMSLDDAKIEIEKAHRIGKPDTNRPNQRPTIVKLLRFKDFEEIIQNAKSLKGSNLFIRETFSERVEQSDATGRLHT